MILATQNSVFGKDVACAIQNDVKTLKKDLQASQNRTTISGA
jgi:hypothetical protein